MSEFGTNAVTPTTAEISFLIQTMGLSLLSLLSLDQNKSLCTHSRPHLIVVGHPVVEENGEHILVIFNFRLHGKRLIPAKEGKQLLQAGHWWQV